MEKLPYKTNKILRKINKLKQFSIKVCDMEDISILSAKGYIQIHNTITTDKLVNNVNWIEYFTITNKGKIYLSSLRDNNFKIYLPIAISTVLSITAIVISIIALLKP